MGTSFVEIGGKGFWMQDSILELWLRLLAFTSRILKLVPSAKGFATNGF